MRENDLTMRTRNKVLLAALLITAAFTFTFAPALGTVASAQASPPRGFPLYSWGDIGLGAGGDGRLGRAVDAANPQDLPARVGNRNDWVLVASAAGGSKAIDTQGRLWTWGPSGAHRGLGPGVTQRSVPYRVGTADNWTHVASLASVVVALNSDGHIYSWGANAQGQLGQGDAVDRNVPTRVRVSTGPGECMTVFTHVSVGTAAGSLTIALTNQGYIYSWGNSPESGLGRPVNVVPANRPGRVVTPHNNWVHVESGGSRVGMAICTQGYLYSWGATTATLGRATDAVANPANRPRRVENISNVVDVVMTSDTVAAVTEEGHLYTWGGSGAALGRAAGAPNPAANRPGRVEGNNWTAVMGGWAHFIALTEQNEIFAWGSGADGRLGLGGGSANWTNRDRPTRVGYIIGASGAARGGGSHSLVLMDEFSLTPATAAFVINKDLRKLQGTTLPSNLAFEFDIEPHSFNGNPALANQLPAIPTANRSVTITSTSSSTTAGGITTLEEYVDFLRNVEFEAAGTFAWMISEVENSSGITANPPSNLRVNYSEARYEVRVTVVESGLEFDISTIVLLRHVTADGVVLSPPQAVANHGNELTFTNTFQRWSSGTNTCAGALSVSKEIDGDFADPATPFLFNVTLTGTALCVAGTEFSARLYGPNNNFIRTENFTVNVPRNNVPILDGQTLVFPYLPVGLSWVVEEQAIEGFTARIDRVVNGTTLPTFTNPHPNLLLSSGTHTITAENLRNSAHFTNIHFISPPMGLVIQNGAPYAVVVLAGLMLGAVLVPKAKARRRVKDRSDDEHKVRLNKPIK